MRSTGFVILSIAVHCVCVAAIALSPTRTVSNAGDKIEVQMGEPAEKPGVAEAAPSPEESKPQAIAEPQPKAEVKPEVKQPEVKKPAPVKTVKAAKPAPVKTVVAAAQLPKKQSAEVLDPVIDETDTTAPAAKSAAVVSEDVPKEDAKEILMPVKETAPVGVEAANSEEDTEAKSEDLQKAADPSPVAVATATPVATETGDLTKGGASKEGAVSFLELKQLPGNKAPAYPMQARREKRQGQMELLYRVTKEGKVADIQVAKSSGFKDLDSEAVKAVSQFKFVPGQEGWARHPISFNLKGPVATMPSQLRGKGAQAD